MTQNNNSTLYRNVCHTGGAVGTDQGFATFIARNLTGMDYTYIHHMYEHQSTKRFKNSHLYTYKELQRNVGFIKEIATILKKSDPSKWRAPIQALILRNFFQVVNSDSMYAVGIFDTRYPGQKVFVNGGSGWAVEMFKKLHREKPLFFYDLASHRWHYWSPYSLTFIEIGSELLPVRPTGMFTGIGTRDTTEREVHSILDELFFNKTKNRFSPVWHKTETKFVRILQEGIKPGNVVLMMASRQNGKSIVQEANRQQMIKDAGKRRMTLTELDLG